MKLDIILLLSLLCYISGYKNIKYDRLLSSRTLLFSSISTVSKAPYEDIIPFLSEQTIQEKESLPLSIESPTKTLPPPKRGRGRPKKNITEDVMDTGEKKTYFTRASKER